MGQSGIVLSRCDGSKYDMHEMMAMRGHTPNRRNVIKAQFLHVFPTASRPTHPLPSSRETTRALAHNHWKNVQICASSQFSQQPPRHVIHSVSKVSPHRFVLQCLQYSIPRPTGPHDSRQDTSRMSAKLLGRTSRARRARHSSKIRVSLRN